MCRLELGVRESLVYVAELDGFGTVYGPIDGVYRMHKAERRLDCLTMSFTYFHNVRAACLLICANSSRLQMKSNVSSVENSRLHQYLQTALRYRVRSASDTLSPLVWNAKTSLHNRKTTEVPATTFLKKLVGVNYLRKYPCGWPPGIWFHRKKSSWCGAHSGTYYCGSM